MTHAVALARARAMRASPTPGEAWLWSRLRRAQFGVQFRRQYVLEPYVLDFYCPKAKLVVELDGGSHDGREAYDEERAAFLREGGLTVLRFGSELRVSDGDGIMEEIVRALESAGIVVPPRP